MTVRKERKIVYCGDVAIGGNVPVSIQSMTNTDTGDIRASQKQIEELEAVGCQIVRLAVPDMEAAEAFGKIKKTVKLPLVADIHFDYRLAIAAIENGADKVRINPGNIGSLEKIKKIVEKAKEYQIPIRIGVNSGSLESDIRAKYNGVTADGLVESAIRSVSLVEDMDFDDIVVSMKSSDVALNYEAHLKLAEKLKYPIHIGITEAGTSEGRGKIKSAIGVGALLLAGIGDTMRVSLTGDPVNEIKLAQDILTSVGLRRASVNIISCPTCGRTKIDLEEMAGRLEENLHIIEAERKRKKLPPVTVAVMGCAVNGPGEAKEADIGIAGGDGKAAIFIKGKTFKTVDEEEAFDMLIKMLMDGVV